VAGNTYEARLYANDGYTLIAKTSPFTVVTNTGQSTPAALYYYHNDHLGTPQTLTDQAGAVVWRATYDPFGQATVNEDPDGNGVLMKNNVRYAGQYFDAETGLHYNWHRYYDPKVGRYISSDPIGLRGGLNTYLYARANPLKYIDPAGLETTLVCRPIAAVGAIGMSKPVHCSVIVWHWEEKCGKKVRVIDAQYSLSGGARRPTTNTNDQTYLDDRNAFSNPGGNNNLYNIPPPSSMSQGDFDQNVISSGNTYSQDPYWPTGPNSNTAAFDIIRNAGGTPPNVPGAWGQGYVNTPLPNLPMVP
jgi:RHS repeat-associated protein